MTSPETANLRKRRLERGRIKSENAKAAAKDVALGLIQYTQARAAAVAHAKQRGLTRGISDLEKSLERLRQQCIIHRQVFGLTAADDSFTPQKDQQPEAAVDQTHANLHAELCHVLAGRSCDANASGSRDPTRVSSAVSKSSSNVQAGQTAGGPPAPPPLPPPLPGKLAPKASPPPPPLPSSAVKWPGPAPPPPPPGPPPPNWHKAAAAKLPAIQHKSVVTDPPSSAGTASSRSSQQLQPRPAPPAGTRAPPPAPPLPPSPLTRGGKIPAAAATAAAHSAGAGGPKAAPPPPPLPGSLGTKQSKQLSSMPFAADSPATAPVVEPTAKHLAIAGPFAIAQAAAASNSAAAALPADSAVSAAGGKLKVLHVDPVPMHKLAEGSFWTVADPVAKPFKDSMEYLLRTMFSDVPRRRIEHSPRGSIAAGDSASNTPRDQHDGAAADSLEGNSVVKCVAEKRALHVEVVLKRLRIPAEELAAAINLANFTKLQPDDLASIRSILPKPEELVQVREAARKAAENAAAAASTRSPRTPLAAAAATPPANGSKADSSCDSGSPAATSTPQTPRLGIVEAAFMALGAVDLLQAKMRAMEFRYDVETVASLVSDYAHDIGRALDALRGSGQLQYLLAFVRDVANTMNRAHKAPLTGFKLESLTRLQSTKMAGATDLNLLHYIVAHLSAVLPGVLVLDAERDIFRVACKRGTFDAVSARIRTVLDTQKRLMADLASARKMQQQRQTQQPQENAATLSPQQLPAAAEAAPDFATSSPQDSHDVYVQRLKELLTTTAPIVDNMQQQLEDLIIKFRWTAEYYCEDVDKQAWKQQPVAFLTHFLDLLDSLAATHNDKARLTRVTTILADYVEMEKTRSEQREQELLQLLVLEQLQPEQGKQSDSCEGSCADGADEQHSLVLLAQQELLRLHAASSGLSADPSSLPVLAADCVSSESSPTSGAQAEGQAVLQHKCIPVVPRLPLEPTAIPYDLECTSQVSWGSDSVASSADCPAGSTLSAASAADSPIEGCQLPASRCCSPMRQPVFCEAGVVRDPGALDSCSGGLAALGLVTPLIDKQQMHGNDGELARESSDSSSSAAQQTRSSIGSVPDATLKSADDTINLGQIAAAVAAIAAEQVQRRGGTVDIVSKSLDDGSELQWKDSTSPKHLTAEQHFMQPTASSNIKSNSGDQQQSKQADTKQRSKSASYQKQPQPPAWRPAGRSDLSASKRAGTSVAIGGRKWTAADAQLAAAAATTASAMNLGRARSTSPVKATQHQQRLQSLRLRGHGKSSAEKLEQPQQQQVLRSPPAAGATSEFEGNLLAQLLSDSDSD